jgi:hypothetical protein
MGWMGNWYFKNLAAEREKAGSGCVVVHAGFEN